MLSVLIVEDDSFKNEALITFIRSVVAEVKITVASNVASAVQLVQNNSFDVIVLDMALPSHPVVSGGGSPLSLLNGGLEVLFELHAMERNDCCVVITQYPEIEIMGQFFSVNDAKKAIADHLECDVIACLQYIEEGSEWKFHLSTILKKYENISFGR